MGGRAPKSPKGGEREGGPWKRRNTGGRDEDSPSKGAGPAKGGAPDKGKGPSKGGSPGKATGPSRGSGPAKDGTPTRGGKPFGKPGAPRDARSGSDQRRPGPRRPFAPVLPVTVNNDLLYGRNAVLEALRGHRTLRRLWVAEGVREDERIDAILELAEARRLPVERVPRELLDDSTRGVNHQGVGLDAGPYEYAELSEVIEGRGTVLVLDHLQDPQNFGTLLRAAEAAGVAGVIIPEDRAVAVTPAVVNASAGAVEHLVVAATPNLPRALEDLKASGRWVLGLAGEEDSEDLFGADVPMPAVLVVGAEGTGLGKRVRSICDLLVSLPMRGQVESLNASTAGAIALYDLVRRERASVD